MAKRTSHPPPIVECRWGVIQIDGVGTFKDAKLYPGGAREWDWNETGTRHVPGIQPADVVELIERGATTIVLSRGVLSMLQVCAATLRQLEAVISASRSCRPPRRCWPTTVWSQRVPPSAH